MRGYRFGPLHIASCVPLPELEQRGARPRRHAWRIRHARRGVDRRVRPLQSWTFPDGRPWASVGSSDDGAYVVRFARVASFLVDPAAREIRMHRAAGVPPATLRHLLLDQVLPLVAAADGHVVVHASAITIGGGAVGLVAPSGFGKSTLAAVCARHGATVVADDCLVIDARTLPPVAIPSYAGLRLWPDALHAFFPGVQPGTLVAHYTSKRRVAGGMARLRFRRTPVPVRALCVLRRGRGPARVVRLRGHAAFVAVLRCTFHLDVGKRSADTLEDLWHVLREVPVFSLEVPRGFERMQMVPMVIEEALAS